MNNLIRLQHGRYPLLSVASVALFVAMLALFSPGARAASVYIRFKVTQPAGDRIHVVVGGFRHSDPWYFPNCPRMWPAARGARGSI